MKKMTYFVMVLALVLGFTQCKKEQIEPQNQVEQVRITLNVGGNGGSRHTINTNNGDVDFQNGDVIYVGDGSTYIGTLTRENDVFSGNINAPANNTEIYFYFVGGLTPSSDPEAGSTTSFTVDISDQSTKMPVLSCNHVTYYSNTTSYSCKLENQCALVKFTTASTTAPVHVGGLYTRAMIDFDNNSITNNGTTGFVALNSKNATEKWAVLLPQTGFSAEAAVAHVGYTTTIPTIEADAFITGNDAVSISTQSNIVYLDWLTSNYTATDGQTLKGTLAGNYQISIADGATVTLRNATITGENDEDYSWAGLTCLGNATIVLADGTTNNVKGFNENYPGISFDPGKTLTIQGTGTLNASSNGWGAGIGGNDEEDCGNIVINNGIINATGGDFMAGIGGGYTMNCGNITINGGTVTATGGRGAAGIGLGYANTDITCGDISITGGIVNATGGLGAAGIGSGFVHNSSTINDKHNTCGNISITGGQVTATGGNGGDHAYPDIMDYEGWTSYSYNGGAGIGTGSTVNDSGANAASSSCGYISITGGQVTATKGGGTRPATNSIGKNESSYNHGTCGTITIGGTVYPSGATPNQSDGLTFVYPAPAPVIPEGAVNGLFSVSSTKQVYFSKGNLQYIGSAATPYWKFADNQWDVLGTTTGQNSSDQNVDRDLFGWATSGYNHNNHSYQPWETNETQANYYAYNNQALNLWQENGQAEWGYNAISNGGNQENIGWHTLIPARWEYLFYTRTTSSGIRYAKAQVNGVNGMIMLPDDWNTSYYTLNSTNKANANYNTNVISLEKWNNELEPHGAVFLPDAGLRVGTTISTAISCYWTSDQFYSYQNKDECCNLWMHNTGFSFATMERYKGASVRLVIDAN